MLPTRVILLALCIAGSWPIQARAQAGSASVPEAAVERSGDQADSLDDSIEAANDAALLQLLDPQREITWEEVLADPDDVSLNFLWAQSQVRTGELRGAAATLERILLMRPELGGVRLLYAVVLFRLDSLAEAERELERLAEQPLSRRDLREVERYLDAIRRRQRRTNFAAAVTVGTQYDSNRNSSPSSGTSLAELGFGGSVELDLGDESLADDDVGFFGLTELRVDHDLGTQEGHRVFAAISTYYSKQIEQTDFDLRSLSGEIGGLYRANGFDLMPRAYSSVLQIAEETLVHGSGLELVALREISPRLLVRGHVGVEYQDFDNTTTSLNAEERSGLRSELGIGLAYQLLPTHRVEVRASGIHKWADGSATDRTSGVFGRIGPEVRLRHTWLLGRGQFLISGVTWGRDDYRRPDFRIDESRSRLDHRLRASLVYGAPVSFLVSPWVSSELLEGLLVSVQVDHYQQWSNIVNYQYDNTRVALMFTRAISF